MVRKNIFNALVAFAVIAAGCLGVVAQTGAPIGGQVLLEKDGQSTPVAGALVEVYRTDIKSKFPSDKSDKKGYFRFAGVPFGAVFVLSVSGPGIAPTIYPNVRAGMDAIVIKVQPGDGKVLPEDEVRRQLALGGGTTGATTSESAEQKKAREEEEKKIAEIKAKNDKIGEINRVTTEAMANGNKAFEAKDYDTAIAKYEEGYNADPAFIGSAPAFLNNKSAAMINRATESYNKSVPKEVDSATKNSLRESARKDLDDAVAASNKALELLNSGAGDPSQKAQIDSQKVSAIINRKNAFRLMAQTNLNIERGKEALVAFQEYLAIETDAAKKAKGQLDLAQTLQDSAEFDLAIVEFEKVLAEDPNNVNGLAGIGLSMMAVGYTRMESGDATGKEMLQQAANYLQKFVDLAPDGHKFKADVTATLIQLKEQQKVTPQKVNTKTTTTKKRN